MTPLSDIKKAMEAGPVAWKYWHKVDSNKVATVSVRMDMNMRGADEYVEIPLYAIDIAALLQHIEALEAEVERLRKRNPTAMIETQLPVYHEGLCEAQDRQLDYTAFREGWRSAERCHCIFEFAAIDSSKERDVSTELPELPESHHQGILGRRFFDSDQMRAYALAASAPLQAQVEALQAEVAMLKRTPLYSTRLAAKRYQWLREVPVCIAWPDFPRMHDLDEAIDAAMASAAQESDRA